jgi:hypothetical protein
LQSETQNLQKLLKETLEEGKEKGKETKHLLMSLNKR